MTAIVFALFLAAAPRVPAQFVAETPTETVAGRTPIVAADGALNLETPTGPVTLSAGKWLAARRAGLPLPAWPGGAQLVFTSGDRVAGRAVGGDARRLRFAPAFAPESAEAWAVPLTAVASLWVTPPRTDTESEAVAPPWAAPKGDTLRSELGQVIGRLLAFQTTPPGVRFRPERGAPLEVPMAGVRALAFDPAFARPPKLRTPALRATLEDGSRLTFTNWELTPATLTGRTAFGVEVTIPAPLVVMLEPLAPNRLPESPPAAVIAEGYAGAPAPWHAGRASNGTALRLREFGGVSTYDGGFGIPARTRLTFDLPEDAKLFTARVGIDPAQARPGSVTVSVEVDGKPITKAVLHALDEPLAIRADVTGGKRLTLVTDFADSGGVGAAANWVMARVIGAE